MLTKFFKSELFRVYRKLITWSTSAKGLLWTEPWNDFFKASTKFEPITCALLVWLSYNWSHWKGMQEAKVHNFVINRNVTNRGKLVYKKASKLNDCKLFKQIFHWTSNLNPFSVNRWVSQKKKTIRKIWFTLLRICFVLLFFTFSFQLFQRVLYGLSNDFFYFFVLSFSFFPFFRWFWFIVGVGVLPQINLICVKDFHRNRSRFVSA